MESRLIVCGIEPAEWEGGALMITTIIYDSRYESSQLGEITQEEARCAGGTTTRQGVRDQQEGTAFQGATGLKGHEASSPV